MIFFTKLFSLDVLNGLINKNKYLKHTIIAIVEAAVLKQPFAVESNR